MAIELRKAVPDDVDNIRQLFYDTVTIVNSRHYNEAQIAAWSASCHNRNGWANKVNEQHFIIAQDGLLLAGFSSITDTGYLDFMFVHAERQGRGIAAILLAEIEKIAASLQLNTITTHASITAKPFFEKQGFEVVKQQTVALRGVELTNFIMQKKLNLPAAQIAAVLSSMGNI